MQMNIINFILKGVIKDIYIGMGLQDFNKVALSKKVTDTAYLCEETKAMEFMHAISVDIEIRFLFDKIASIPVDPRYDNVRINDLKLTSNLSLNKLINCYHDTDIKWRFACRDYDNELELITESGVSVIFTFEQEGSKISKFRLQK